MIIEYLNWDSDFFGIKIGQVRCSQAELNNADLIELFKQAKRDQYRLLYFIGDRDLHLDNVILEDFNGKLVDRKIIFGGVIDDTQEDTSLVEEYHSTVVAPALEQLAYISAEFSRFKLDVNFKKADFKRLYQVWITNSVQKVIADKVFVIIPNEKIQGMITLSVKNGVGVIGLLAIDDQSKGKGFGKQLVNQVKKYLYAQGVDSVEVATQSANVNACRFYEKCGLREKVVSHIYHFWI
ncbi:GNAT family N-acetyltransferase [Pedobacter immunditicola]|uniref:GNAT family N-acetyltransferase n=1 Tax=Pedobacter immunditicola TaxID=3133440 RepID=UPI00309D1E11